MEKKTTVTAFWSDGRRFAILRNKREKELGRSVRSEELFHEMLNLYEKGREAGSPPYPRKADSNCPSPQPEVKE